MMHAARIKKLESRQAAKSRRLVNRCIKPCTHMCNMQSVRHAQPMSMSIARNIDAPTHTRTGPGACFARYSGTGYRFHHRPLLPPAMSADECNANRNRCFHDAPSSSLSLSSILTRISILILIFVIISICILILIPIPTPNQAIPAQRKRNPGSMLPRPR